MSKLLGRGPYRSEAYPVRSAALPSALVSVLSNQFWVDTNTTVPADQRTGSVVAPFKTLQAAYDAGAAALLTQLSIIAVALDPNEDLVMTAALKQLSIVGLSGSVGFVATPVVKFHAIQAAGASAEDIFLQNIQLDRHENGAQSLILNGCIYNELLTATSLSLVSSSPGFATTPDVQAAVVFFSDYASEQTLFVQAGTLTLSSIRSTAGGPNIAIIGSDASVTNNFGPQSRLIYPDGLLTAARTLTLGSGGTKAIGARAVLDVYTQTQDLNAVDQASAITLTTITAGSAPTRATFVWDGTNWSLAYREILAA